MRALELERMVHTHIRDCSPIREAIKKSAKFGIFVKLAKTKFSLENGQKWDKILNLAEKEILWQQRGGGRGV